MTAEEEILGILGREGPLTGKELLGFWGKDRFLLWQTCHACASLEIVSIGRRYLRLDERVEGYSRLSPSILREFLTYTVIGTEPSAIRAKAELLREEIGKIGEWKTRLAAETVSLVLSRLSRHWTDRPQPCFVMAGDIAYGMAHEEPRPETSTGRMVKGSDLDIVAILDDSVPDELFALLDEEIYKQKYQLLVNPAINQEIDYIVKKVSKFREQLRFDTFKRMIACKIIKEGFFLGGDRGLFDEVKLLLKESGIEERVDAMEAGAALDRDRAVQTLTRADSMSSPLAGLFYSTQESEEFD